MDLLSLFFMLLLAMRRHIVNGGKVLCWRSEQRRTATGVVECAQIQEIQEKDNCCAGGGLNRCYTDIVQKKSFPERFRILSLYQSVCKSCTDGATRKKPACKPCAIDCEGTHPGDVCGNDGKTYESECKLKQTACTTPVPLAYRGKCKKHCAGVSCPVGLWCTADSQGDSHCIRLNCQGKNSAPSEVCGTNAITYPSEHALCEAGKSINKFFVKAYDEACKPNPTCADVTCPAESKCVKIKTLSKVRCLRCRWTGGRIKCFTK